METQKQILQKIDDCISNGSLSTINEEVAKLLNISSKEQVSQAIATLFVRQYTLYRADYLARILEDIIHGCLDLALVGGANNPLFRMVIFKGSVDLYECYMEEAIFPFLETMNEEDKYDYYTELMCVAQSVSDACFDNYTIVRKGLDFNGGVPGTRFGFITIAEEDYEVMNTLCEHYNAIIGRRDILKNLGSLGN